MSLEKMTIQQLQVKLDGINAKRDQLKEEARQVSAALDAKLTQRRVQEKLAAMGDAERTALLQLLQAEAIPSAEVVVGLQQ